MLGVAGAPLAVASALDPYTVAGNGADYLLSTNVTAANTSIIVEFAGATAASVASVAALELYSLPSSSSSAGNNGQNARACPAAGLL